MHFNILIPYSRVSRADEANLDVFRHAPFTILPMREVRFFLFDITLPKVDVVLS